MESSSSTEITDISSPSSPCSNRDITEPEILVQTRNLISHGIHYAANTDIASQCEFMFNKDLRGDVLILKGSQALHSELVLSGIFQIDTHNLFMTSDTKWNSNNPLSTCLDQAKATCNLQPVNQNTDFEFSAQHFPNIIGNLHAIKNLANPQRSRDTSSIIVNNSNAIKIIHHLFIVSQSFNFLDTHHLLFFKKEKRDPSQLDKNNDLQIEEYTIDDWLINPSNKSYLNAIKGSHCIHLIPAYNIKGTLIPPAKYEEKLAGAIVHVCFTIVHFIIKHKHIYNAVVRDISIIRPPTTISTATLRNVLHPNKKN